MWGCLLILILIASEHATINIIMDDDWNTKKGYDNVELRWFTGYAAGWVLFNLYYMYLAWAHGVREAAMRAQQTSGDQSGLVANGDHIDAKHRASTLKNNERLQRGRRRQLPYYMRQGLKVGPDNSWPYTESAAEKLALNQKKDRSTLTKRRRLALTELAEMEVHAKEEERAIRQERQKGANCDFHKIAKKEQERWFNFYPGGHAVAHLKAPHRKELKPLSSAERNLLSLFDDETLLKNGAKLAKMDASGLGLADMKMIHKSSPGTLLDVVKSAGINDAETQLTVLKHIQLTTATTEESLEKKVEAVVFVGSSTYVEQSRSILGQWPSRFRLVRRAY